MSSRKGAPSFPALMKDCVLWFPGYETTEFPIIPSGVTVTPFSAPLTIGKMELDSNYTNSNLKDLMIFKGRALTLPEIKLLMARTHPITGLGLLPGGYDYYQDVV